MSDPLPFPVRRTPDAALRRVSHSLAEKLQQLVLRHPIAAVEVEKFVDRLLVTLDAQKD